MDILWQKESATVAEVADKLPGPPLAYSTIITTLRILEEKGHVRHTKKGRAFVYQPVIGRREARENALMHLVRRFFEGSTDRLVLSLIEEKKVSPKELRRLRKLLEEDKGA